SLKSPTSDPVIHDQNGVAGDNRSHKKKGMDKLKHELFNPLLGSDMIEISKTACPKKILPISEENSSSTSQIAPAKADNNDDEYFYSEDGKVKGANGEVSKLFWLPVIQILHTLACFEALDVLHLVELIWDFYNMWTTFRKRLMFQSLNSTNNTFWDTLANSINESETNSSLSSFSGSSNLSGILDITSDIKIRFKQYFDRLMKARNYTFDEMCYSIVIDIHSLGGNIKTSTVKNFYNSVSGSRVSTINQINAW
ncbi:14078_t:CDS:2, partial [Funneliformis caledonium]